MIGKDHHQNSTGCSWIYLSKRASQVIDTDLKIGTLIRQNMVEKRSNKTSM